MIKARDISIRNKLVIIQLITSLVVLGLFVTAFLYLDIKGYKKRRIENLQALAEVIGTNAVSPLQFQDNEAAYTILKNMIDVSPRLSEALIRDNKGKLFASYQPKNRTSPPVPAGLTANGFSISGKSLFVSREISDPNGVIGTVIVVSELNDLYSLNREKYIVSAILVGIAIVLSLIIAWLIQSYISKRLLSLTDIMRTVTRSGDYNKVINDDGKDEIGILSQSFNRLMANVRDNQRRKDEFIAVASHELKTPLTSVKGYLELFKMVNNDDQSKLMIVRALSNVQKLERLVNDLLDVSKIQSGHLELRVGEFDVVELLVETIAYCQMLSPHHQIELVKTKPVMLIKADKNRLEQVFVNLISNAIKYSPGESKVIVAIEDKEGVILVSVRDFGTGVPKGSEHSIFERFYRAESVSEHISGFGLGLYICKSIVDKHHGKIWMNNEEKGCTFSVILPVSGNVAN